MSFVHLHSHSEYSMLDGASRIKEMFARAAALEMPALGLTDHGVMYGAIPFYLEGKNSGVKPIIGMEGYVAPKSRFDRPAAREDWYYHLTILAADIHGYRNLMKLSSLGFLEGYDGRSRRPRLDKELLAKYSEGLVVLSGCLSGELAKNVVNGNLMGACDVAREYKEIFGDRYFLEIQNQGLADQGPLNQAIAKMGADLNIPLVATNDSHYTHKEDAAAHDILLCIQTGKELADSGRLKFDSNEFFLKSPAEMALAFPDYPEALENTLRVAEMCDVEIELGNLLLPVFEVPAGETLESHLRKMTFKGLDRIYQPLLAEIQERADYELSVISKMGFSGYFLIVADFVNWAKQSRIRVGPGRGSVGGSIVAYALGITDLDPIRWNLPFERFLNEGRKSMPDIDIDFDDRRRGEVIKYVSQKYGEDRVAQIITFSTIKAKQAMRDAARVLGFPYSVGDRLAKMYPPSILGKDAPFDACFDRNHEWPPNAGRNDAWGNAGDLRRAYEEDEISRKVIDAARKLEGLRRQHSIHAAGVVIGKDPLTNHVPIQKTDEEIVTQYEMTALDAIGLLKIDFLGLRNLTVIEDALTHIQGNRGIEVEIDKVPLDDRGVFDLLKQGKAYGIFQMESPGMTRLLRQMQPDRFEEIAALIALYRPGPMEEIPRYVKGKLDSSSVTYYHPLLEPVLADTNGVIVYQEQVTEMLQRVAGFTPQEADMVRYAIGKKKSDVLVKYREQFDKGCREKGLTEREAAGLWDLILPFAGYSFNRAHANGYGLIAYQTAYLKAHFPVEYMAALLTSVKNNPDRMPVYLAECRGMGLRVQPPSVNSSLLDFTPRGDEILFGLSAIRNVGEQVAERIISVRGGEPFESFHDFVRRADPSCLNKKVVESLAKAGAFDELGLERGSILDRDDGADGGLVLSDFAMRSIETVLGERRSEDAGQFSLFAGSDAEGEKTTVAVNGFHGSLPSAALSRSELLSAEKEVLGFFVSEHPLQAVEGAIRYQADCEINELQECPDGAVKTLGGILVRITRKFTKKGEMWITATLEDRTGSVDVIVWPQAMQQAPAGLLTEDSIILMKGRIEVRDENVKLIGLEVRSPDLTGAATPLRIRMQAAACTPDRLTDLKAILSAHPGPSPVLLHLGSSERVKVLKLGMDYSVELRNGLYAELKSVLGPDALVE